MIEALVATFILVLTMSMLTLCIQTYQKMEMQVRKGRQIDWHLFLNQLENELKETSCLSVEKEKAIFKYNEKSKKQGIFFYEKYNQMIRKRTTNGSGGHQPMLLEIDVMEFIEEDGQLKINVTFTNREYYSGKVNMNDITKEEAN